MSYIVKLDQKGQNFQLVGLIRVIGVLMVVIGAFMFAIGFIPIDNPDENLIVVGAVLIMLGFVIIGGGSTKASNL